MSARGDHPAMAGLNGDALEIDVAAALRQLDELRIRAERAEADADRLCNLLDRYALRYNGKRLDPIELAIAAHAEAIAARFAP